ncbi:BH0509 family protein [Brevibacillus sp. SYSU BS000544]
MITRQERKNMIDHISKRLGWEHDKFVYMTDDDIEYYYSKSYCEFEYKC